MLTFTTITPRALTLAAAGILAAAPLGAAGTHGTGHEAPEIGVPAKASEADRVVEVVMTDNAYSIEGLEVKDGETVTFVLRNKGDFVHEFNIGTSAMHEQHQEEMMAMMDEGRMSMDSKPAGMGHDDANSILLDPGEEAEFTWTFARNDALEFACNVPGHYQSGMMGPVEFEDVSSS